MKIISWNINGFRSPSMNVIKDDKFNEESNLYKLLKEEDPDILCLCETKCQLKNESMFNKIMPFEYNIWNSSTIKLGYSGVVIYSKVPFINHGEIEGLEGEKSGRYIYLEFDKFNLLYAYVPNSGSNEKFRKEIWDPSIHNLIKKHMINNEKPFIYGGDLNVVATDQDIYNRDILAKGKFPGTKVFERDNFKNLLDLNMIDSHRDFIKTDKKLYTWWDPRRKMRLKDKGWRLDYFLVSKSLIVRGSKICNETLGSDHCPIVIEF